MSFTSSFTSSFYTIPIPCPEYEGIQQLAQVLDTDANVTVFYWRKATKQVVIEASDGNWYIQPDGLITKSLAALFDCSRHNIVATNLFMFERPGHGKAMDQETTIAFYECDWSDYANDHIAIDFTVEIDRACTSNIVRLLKVVRTLIDDEDYADMPALIPIGDYDYDNDLYNAHEK